MAGGAQIPGGLVFQEDGAVQHEEGDGHESHGEGVRIEQIPETADIVHVGVNRHAAQHVGEGHTEQQRRDETADKDAPVPQGSPAGMEIFAAKLKGDAAHDKGQQEKEERQVEGAEHGCVPFGKGGKGGAAGGEQPHFVAVPMGADGVDHHAPRLVPLRRKAPAQEGEENADAEIKAF